MMAKNESSIAGVIVLFFFGIGLVSAALHWRISSSLVPNTSFNRAGDNVGRDAAVASQPLNDKQQTKPVNKIKNPRRTVIARGPTRGPIHHESAFTPSSRDTRVVVDLTERRVFVYNQDILIASYPIGVGKKGWETPVGSFKVMHMQHDPAWRHPITGRVFPSGPNSPLGERWIGFWSDGHNKIGFHGTPDEDLVGSPVSHGCLRMRNPDVRLFYEQVRIGTPVEVKHSS